MEIGKKGADVCFRVSTYVHAREEVIREVLLKEEQELWEILIRGEEQSAGIWVRLGEKMICACDKVSLLAYTTEEAGGFVGCTIGMYASSHGTDSKNYADYVSFTCSGAEE
jgi:xylan 1,4-beta-xylosidase